MKIFIPFNDFVSGFCELEFAAIYSLQKGVEMQNMSLFSSDRGHASLTSIVILLDTSQKINLAHQITHNTFKQGVNHA